MAINRSNNAKVAKYAILSEELNIFVTTAIKYAEGALEHIKDALEAYEHNIQYEGLATNDKYKQILVNAREKIKKDIAELNNKLHAVEQMCTFKRNLQLEIFEKNPNHGSFFSTISSVTKMAKERGPVETIEIVKETRKKKQGSKSDLKQSVEECKGLAASLSKTSDDIIDVIRNQGKDRTHTISISHN